MKVIKEKLIYKRVVSCFAPNGRTDQRTILGPNGKGTFRGRVEPRDRKGDESSSNVGRFVVRLSVRRGPTPRQV